MIERHAIENREDDILHARSGVVFGRLTLISSIRYYFPSGQSQWKWKCRCLCGKFTDVFIGNLRSGHTTSCGCIKPSMTAAQSYRHGHKRRNFISSSYSSWVAMHTRCYNENDPAFRLYGARGITICDRWRVYDNFLEDMGDRPVGLTIERIDNNRGYEKANCKWATRIEQGRNTRSTKLNIESATQIFYDARPYTVVASEFGITPGYVGDIKRGKVWLDAR